MTSMTPQKINPLLFFIFSTLKIHNQQLYQFIHQHPANRIHIDIHYIVAYYHAHDASAGVIVL